MMLSSGDKSEKYNCWFECNDCRYQSAAVGFYVPESCISMITVVLFPQIWILRLQIYKQLVHDTDTSVVVKPASTSFAKKPKDPVDKVISVDQYPV